MPYHEPDPSDPSMLVGNVVDCTRDELREMAAAFAGELAELGYDAPVILRMFRRATYAGPHLAWRALGEAAIGRLVGEAVEFWSHRRVVVTDAPTSTDSGPRRPLAMGNAEETERRRT